MSKPVKPVVPPPALRSEPDTFKDRAEANIEFFEPLVEYMDDVADFVDEQADAAVAAAQAGDLPPIAGKALQLLRVNAGGTALDFQAVMSGPTDATAGRIPVNHLNGIFGLGAAGNPPVSSDLLTTTTPVSIVRVEPGTANKPSGVTYGVAWYGKINASDPAILLLDQVTGEIWTLTRYSSVWGSWVKQLSRQDIATQLEAEAGADNTKVMTPLRTKQAVIAKQAVKAWVNFSGTGSVAILDSHNVSSITDNGTGDYTINFATALESANYAFVGSCSSSGGEVLALCLQGGYSSAPTLKTASQIRLHALNAPFRSAADAQNASVIIVQ
ncbi:hypothetical protein [Roseovarius nubinhibens]|uniref:Uncharacterized protein n=1 Tax=Roseovarius nubinhibens (strain ATCC BAA-591 / DSM 15170 / ISM) TaxID=89187 RepID=A3SMR0_ROSNI|nr:hypothetical protein [Roseovarius nubinhibens]EAP75750.1 hypothetical protein ISM_12830 [Roseovarius nubinhibens ISM]